MAKEPSPADAAREILRIFVLHFNCSAGGVVWFNSLQPVFLERGFAAKDFMLGMEFADQEGWVEVAPRRGSFRLTKAGFDAA